MTIRTGLDVLHSSKERLLRIDYLTFSAAFRACLRRRTRLSPCAAAGRTRILQYHIQFFLGEVIYTVKAGTKTDTKVRLKGKGVPSIRNSQAAASLNPSYDILLILKGFFHLIHKALFLLGPGVNGGPRGDLLVEVIVSRHPVFQRQDMHIFSTVPISFAPQFLRGLDHQRYIMVSAHL